MAGHNNDSCLAVDNTKHRQASELGLKVAGLVGLPHAAAGCDTDQSTSLRPYEEGWNSDKPERVIGRSAVDIGTTMITRSR